MTETPIRERALLVLQKNLPELDTLTLEKACKKFTLQYARKKKIDLLWSNPLFQDTYAHKIQSVIFNLKQRPAELLERFHVKDIPFLSSEELNPDLWNPIIEKKKIQEMHMGQKPLAMTNEFKCGKCKKRECIYDQRQVRSCDEPMTLFITCVNCGNKWRM